MYSMYIIHIQSIHSIILVKRRAKSCDPKNRNNGAKQNAIYITSANCFIILYTF